MSQQTCIIPEPAPHLASGKIKREFVLWENFTWLCLAKSNPQTPTTLRSWTKTVDKNCSKTNFWLESSRFPRLSRTINLLSGLPGPGKCQNKIIGLSKFSRTNMNPDYTFYKAALVYMHNEIGMGLQFSTGVWSMSCSVNFFHLLLSQLGCLVPYQIVSSVLLTVNKSFEGVTKLTLFLSQVTKPTKAFLKCIEKGTVRIKFLA